MLASALAGIVIMSSMSTAAFSCASVRAPPTRRIISCTVAFSEAPVLRGAAGFGMLGEAKGLSARTNARLAAGATADAAARRSGAAGAWGGLPRCERWYEVQGLRLRRLPGFWGAEPRQNHASDRHRFAWLLGTAGLLGRLRSRYSARERSNWPLDSVRRQQAVADGGALVKRRGAQKQTAARPL